MAEELDNSNIDVLVKLMHLKWYISLAFLSRQARYLLGSETACLFTIDVPTLVNARGQYHLPEESEHKIKQWHTYFYVKS